MVAGIVVIPNLFFMDTMFVFHDTQQQNNPASFGVLPMHRILLLPFLALIAAAVMLPAAPAGEKKKDDGYVPLFDGKSLDGWHISAKSGHSGKSKNKSGGKWVVVDGYITGTQDEPGNGGIIITDRKYKNFEVVLEMKTTSVSTAACSCAAPRTAAPTSA